MPSAGTVRRSHRAEGDRCTFDALLDELGLDTPPLRHLATIVRGADASSTCADDATA